MTDFDLVVRGGTIVTASDKMICDVGVREGRIVALAEGLSAGKREIDASGRLVMPGGVEGHCHVEQRSSFGIMTADDFYSATVSAAFGGNTTILPFAAQHKGQSLREVVDDYRIRGVEKAVIDFGAHLIVSDPTPEVLDKELPELIREGYPSFKIYTTYDLLRLDDGQVLDVMALARRHGALLMVHAENHDMIRWLTDRLLEKGNWQPKYHAVSHCRVGESEATHRVISMSRLLDTPVVIVHVSTEEAAAEIRAAQTMGLKVFAETCPQYLFLTAEDLNRDGMEGAKFCCSPPPRDQAAHESIWRGIQNGTFQLFSSDHAPYSFDDRGKLIAGPTPPFKKIANGVPGIELRMPLLFSEGVQKGRIDLHRFVALTSTNAAKLYGIFPRKGCIAVGADADLAVWDPNREVVVAWKNLHDNAGYTPYEGIPLRGWPETVVSRGRVVVSDGELHVERGSGKFLRREISDYARPAGRLELEVDEGRNFGARIL